jgi:hydrogenase-4 component B
LSTLILPIIDKVSETLTHISIAGQLTNGFIIFPIFPNFIDVSPLLIAILFAILIPLALYASNKYGGKQKTVYGDSWDCGTPLTARNEYTATAFSQPINRVFGGLYRPKSEVKTVPSESPYIFKEKRLISQEKFPIFEDYLYRPVVNGIKTISNKARKIQNGNILSYLTYIFITLIVLLIIVR